MVFFSSGLGHWRYQLGWITKPFSHNVWLISKANWDCQISRWVTLLPSCIITVVEVVKMHNAVLAKPRLSHYFSPPHITITSQALLVGTNSTRCFFTSNSHHYRSPFPPYYVVLSTIVILCLCLLTPLPSRCLTFLRFWPPCCLILNCCLFCIYKGDKQCCLKTFVVFIWSVGLLRCLTGQDSLLSWTTSCFEYAMPKKLWVADAII